MGRMEQPQHSEHQDRLDGLSDHQRNSPGQFWMGCEVVSGRKSGGKAAGHREAGGTTWAHTIAVRCDEQVSGGQKHRHDSKKDGHSVAHIERQCRPIDEVQCDGCCDAEQIQDATSSGELEGQMRPFPGKRARFAG